MTTLYYYLCLLNAAVSVCVAVAVFWRNRYQAVGPLMGLTMLGTAFWLFGLAQYFTPHSTADALRWARLTLSASLLINPLLFHSMCALTDDQRRYAPWIASAYGLATVLLVLLWGGRIIAGVYQPPNMDHYVRYNRFWYPLVATHIATWQVFGAGVLAFNARRSVGYKRTSLTYFILTWFIVFLATTAIILPLEYGLEVPPFGLFFLPANLALLAYVMGKSRLADYNVVIARGMLYAVTFCAVVGISLVAVVTMRLVAPGFMDPQQVLFSVMLSAGIGVILMIGLPRFLPRVERLMQERMFGKRYGYQDTLAGLVRELGRVSNLDELLQRVATTIHSQMQLSRVLILLEDPLSGVYRLQAESGLPRDAPTDSLSLPNDAAVVVWLRVRKDALVRDEVVRHESPAAVATLDADLSRLGAVVCIPMILDDQLAGLIALGPKVSSEMFFISDLKVLETLATEVALALKYRRMEDQILRKNKLIELGTIAAGVAHEIRNPLASIRTFAQLLPDKQDDPEFKQEFSKLVLKDVDRITKVVESVLAFARPAQVTIAEHSVTELVEEAALLTAPRLKAKRIELIKQYHERPILRVDKQQILQVLVNLINNAIDVLPEHGKIRVATGVRTMNDATEGAGQQKFVVIEVADNGPGIPVAVRHRVFDPFFTTKKDGTGLGLSISQKIARDHGGIITVSSIEGKGTAFQVNLPLN